MKTIFLMIILFLLSQKIISQNLSVLGGQPEIYFSFWDDEGATYLFDASIYQNEPCFDKYNRLTYSYQGGGGYFTSEVQNWNQEKIGFDHVNDDLAPTAPEWDDLADGKYEIIIRRGASSWRFYLDLRHDYEGFIDYNIRVYGNNSQGIYKVSYYYYLNGVKEIDIPRYSTVNYWEYERVNETRDLSCYFNVAETISENLKFSGN